MKRVLGLIFSCAFILAVPASAEDIHEVFKKVEEYAQQKNFPKALEELQWAQKELEKMHQQRLGELLPGSVDGFTGEEPQFQSAMGFSSIERQYVKGDDSIRLSIAGAAGADGMGGLAGLAKMGMMMGGTQPGKEQFRIDGRTATLDTSNGSPELTVLLESGGILQLQANGESVNAAALKKFAQALKLGDLDSYLKGSKS